MKKITAVVLPLIFIFSIGCGASQNGNTASNPGQNAGGINTYRDIPGITADEIYAIEALKDEYGDFSFGSLIENDFFQLPDGTYAKLAGEFYDLLSDLFEVEFTRVYYEEWDEFKDSLKNHEVDFVGIFMPSPERLDEYLTSSPIAGRALHVYTLSGFGDINEESDINGRRIAFLSDTSTEGLIKERYPKLSFESVEVSRFSEAAQLLTSGEIDALIADSTVDPTMGTYDYLQFNELFPLVNKSVCLATANPRFEPVIAVFNRYLNAGGAENLYQIYKESEYGYKKHKLFLTFTGEEKAYIADRIARGAKVDVGLQHDAYPVSFYNVNDNEFQGVAIDILGEIAKLTGLEFTHITTSTDTPISIILEKLKTGEISMMTQLLYSESRKNDYLWSNAYLETNYALLSKSEFPDLEIFQVYLYKVGTVAKTAHEEMFETWFPDHRRQFVYATTDEAFTALEEGEIDLLMLSENMLLTQTNYREKPGFKINLDFYVPLESYFGFSKSEELLRSVVNKSIEYIELENIGNRWLNRTFDYTKKINDIRTLYLAIFSSAILLVLIAMLFLFSTNKRLSKSLADRTVTLSTIFSSIPDIVFCKNSDGVYTSCNPSFERQAGMPEAEIIGKTYEEVFTTRAAKTAGPYKEIDQRILGEGRVEMIEESVEYPDGSRYLLETLKAPLVQNGKTIGILGIGRDVTERKEIKTRLDQIINSAQIIFMMTIDNVVVEANEFSKNHMGIKIGDDIRDFYGNREHRKNILKMAELHGTTSNVLVELKTADDGFHRFLSSFTTVEYEQKKAFILWGIDIERDEQINDQLRAAQQTLQTIMDTLPLPVCIANAETEEMVYGNKMFIDLMDYDSPDSITNLSGVDIFNAVQKDGSKSADINDFLINITEPVVKELRLRSGKDKIVDVRTHAAPIDYYGNKAIIGFMSDLTQEKETQRILIAAAEREKEANQSKSLFLANMSHEIRTPMNGVIGMTDLLLGEKLSARQMQYAKDIKTSAESLLDIINDILDLSKINEGRLQITSVDIDLSLLLKNTVSMISFSAKSKGLEFIDDININTPEYVKIDDVRLKQILVNLLSNAIKFTQRGYVKFSAKIEDGSILFAVKDTGLGIKQEDISVIFDVFRQADRRKNRAIKGTGLGLSISKNLAELMGGKIWVESEYEAGSVFYVTLPYEKGDEALIEKDDLEFNYISAPTAQVLLVDDIQTNLTVASGLLRLCDITADVALSGREAIEMVKERDYDIVFMDHMMPEMDGVEAMNLIKGMGGKYSELPVIALTANAVNESRDLLISSGMDDFLSKPINKWALMNILKKWLPENKVEAKTASAKNREIVPYSELLTKASEIEGLDIELALSRINGMHEVLEMSIKQVANSLKGKLKNMDNYLAGDNLRNFSIEAHGLKGALANIGATHNSELAAELEIASKAENKNLCVNKFAAFTDILVKLADQLTALFPKADTKNKPSGDEGFLKLKIGETLNFLDNFESTDAENCLKELIKFSFGTESDTIIDDAIAALEVFDYKKAELLLKEINPC